MMDAVSGMDVSVINFMSGCTVLCMAVVSVYRGRKDQLDLDYPVTITLAFGACVGGVMGKVIFSLLPGNASLLQSIILFVINVLIYFYVKFKHKIHTQHLHNYGGCAVVGCVLGGISAFLGIGGGPINIAILNYFFSSSPKVTAKRSIFIILLSQISSLATTMLSGVPENVNYFALTFMCIGGCSGAIVGGKLSKKLSEQQVDDFFTDVLVAIIILNAYNVGRMVG